ncbi:MAG: hypothetical protein JXK51_03105 [Halothiobacillaceae bacterium]|nr:hypothetical protein [Halothiobacillaceae bacterium]
MFLRLKKIRAALTFLLSGQADALLRMGDISPAYEAHGFAAYRANNWGSRLATTQRLHGLMVSKQKNRYLIKNFALNLGNRAVTMIG